MGRIASTLTPAPPRLPCDGGLLLDPATDIWADWGLLGVPDPDRITTTTAALPFREFILQAFPTFQFSRFSELLIELLQQVADGQLTRLIVCCPPRAGKLCAHDTPVPTPTGWRLHGDLQPGDEVFGPDGRPTTVVAVSAEARATMKVTTTRGEVIWCHPEHQWHVRHRRSRRWETFTTEELLSQELYSGVPGQRGSRFLFQLPHVAPLQYPSQTLPLDPYALGYWLGNGSVGKALVTHDCRDREPVVAMIRAGYPVSAVHRHRGAGYERVQATALAGLVTKPGVASPFLSDLKAAGVLHRKHIPEPYMRGSMQQRLELLAGLIDSDGHVDPKGRVRFVTTSAALAAGVLDLTEGLGFRPYRMETPPVTSSSGVIGRHAVISVGFQPTMPIPTRLQRKAISRLVRQRRVSIARVEVDSRSVRRGRCIQVDRPDGLYVVGRQLTVTHNSQLVSRLFPAYWVSRHPELFCAIASYSGELAYAHSREARHYYRITGHALSKDSAAVGNWLTPQRGGCIAAGVKGPFTGKGYNLGIIDDPYKGPEDAKSALQRERLIDWLKSVWFTRAEPGLTATGSLLPAAQVVVQTRWDHHDMTAWLLEQEGQGPEGGENPEHWTVLNLPAIAEPLSIAMPIPPTCTRVPDWRQPGEPLCPERVPLAVLQRIRTRLGSYWWNALYQQRPSPAEGLLFRKAWIQPPLPTIPGQPRRYAPLVLSCDLSFKDGKGNDACGFALLGLLEPQRHPAVDARRQGLALAANAAGSGSGLLGACRKFHHAAAPFPPDPWGGRG